MSGWINHLTITPIVIPLLAGTLMLLIGERRRPFVVSSDLEPAPIAPCPPQS